VILEQCLPRLEIDDGIVLSLVARFGLGVLVADKSDLERFDHGLAVHRLDQSHFKILPRGKSWRAGHDDWIGRATHQ